MHEHWPGICAAAALIGLLVCIIRFHVHAFIALLLASFFLGLAVGLPPVQVVDAVKKGLAGILKDVVLLLALGAMLGRMLEAAGAAELIANRLISACGARHTSLAILLAAFLIGIPVMFNVGFLLLIPIVWRLQRQTNQSLLYFLCPLAFSLGITHSLVPPHPGIIVAVNNIAGDKESGRVMVETIIFGIALSLPLALIGWFGPGRLWAKHQFVTPPENMAATGAQHEPPVARSFALALTIVIAPLVLSVAGFGARLMQDLHALPAWMTDTLFDASTLPSYLRWLNHSLQDWMQFFGTPTIAILAPTALAFWCYGLSSGWSNKKLAKLTSDALIDVGGMVFLFGAAGGFKEVIQQTGVGAYLAQQMIDLPLTPVTIAFLVAAVVRVALGSATASIATASALLASWAGTMPGNETLLVLSIANGVTIGTQPADSGFWMLKEYGNLAASDVMIRFNACRVVIALSGLAILLIVEACRR